MKWKNYQNNSKSKNHQKPWSFTRDFIHKQCGHPGRNKSRMIENMYNIKIRPYECQDCMASKSKKTQMGQGSGECAKHPLELIHVDLATHFLTKTKFTSILVAVDDTSSFTYDKPLCSKADALQVLKEWVNYAKTQTGHKLKALQSNNRQNGSTQMWSHGRMTQDFNGRRH